MIMVVLALQLVPIDFSKLHLMLHVSFREALGRSADCGKQESVYTLYGHGYSLQPILAKKSHGPELTKHFTLQDNHPHMIC